MSYWFATNWLATRFSQTIIRKFFGICWNFVISFWCYDCPITDTASYWSSGLGNIISYELQKTESIIWSILLCHIIWRWGLLSRCWKRYQRDNLCGVYQHHCICHYCRNTYQCIISNIITALSGRFSQDVLPMTCWRIKYHGLTCHVKKKQDLSFLSIEYLGPYFSHGMGDHDEIVQHRNCVVLHAGCLISIHITL